MANTYTQIYIQSVFTVQNKLSLIRQEWQEELYRYITGIVQNNGHKLIAINGMPDHFLEKFQVPFDERCIFKPVEY